MINPGTSLEASQALSLSWPQTLCGTGCAAQGPEEVSIQPHTPFHAFHRFHI